jgi:hypothetical protein
MRNAVKNYAPAGLVLGGGRDVGVAVNHVPLVHQKCASEKANFIVIFRDKWALGHF